MTFFFNPSLNDLSVYPAIMRDATCSSKIIQWVCTALYLSNMFDAMYSLRIIRWACTAFVKFYRYQVLCKNNTVGKALSFSNLSGANWSLKTIRWVCTAISLMPCALEG